MNNIEMEIASLRIKLNEIYEYKEVLKVLGSLAQYQLSKLSDILTMNLSLLNSEHARILSGSVL